MICLATSQENGVWLIEIKTIPKAMLLFSSYLYAIYTKLSYLRTFNFFSIIFSYMYV